MDWFWRKRKPANSVEDSTNASYDSKNQSNSQSSSSTSPSHDLDPQLQSFYDRVNPAVVTASATDNAAASEHVEPGENKFTMPQSFKVEEEAVRRKLLSSQNRKRDSDVRAGAMMNCVEQELEYEDCLANGSLKERATLCENKKRKFWNCYQAQVTILNVLGYSDLANSEELDRKLLGRADELYLEQLAKEAEIEARVPEKS